MTAMASDPEWAALLAGIPSWPSVVDNTEVNLA
jgi:hypothetical protein